MALMRRAALVLRSDGLTADEAAQAYADLFRAEALARAWNTDGEVFEHLPEMRPEGLSLLSSVAWASAHALAIATVAAPGVRAGLWRSLARAILAREERITEETGAAHKAVHAAGLYAECEVLRQNALHHFDACRAGAARACAARAVERARAAHHEDPELVGAKRVAALQHEFDRIHAVAERVDSGVAAARVFDASLLAPCIELPTL
jgi:hypothetical protein